MSFNTLTFLFFYPILFLIYWGVSNHRRLQTSILLAASWLFYGWWDWRYLGLLIALTLTTWATALLAHRGHKRLWTTLNIALALGVLVAFKYFNFFSENIRGLMATLGWNIDWFTLDVLLPVGISFYTFQAIGYSVDVYRGKVLPERDLITFATFLAYFPQLVAGPIERASSLMPQLRRQRKWDYSMAVDGAREALWGMFKKVAIADVAAIYADSVFDNVEALYASCQWHTLFLGAVMFTLQLYCDFSGYCDIARGVSRCLGIEIMQNFRYPMFSRTVPEIWRRWNVSLSRWFVDYLYIPLGGSRRGGLRTIVNIFIVMAVSGLWHGASWMMLLWGLYWGVMCSIFHGDRLKYPWRMTPYNGIPTTLALWLPSWIIFRAPDVHSAWLMGRCAVPVLIVLAVAGEVAIALWWKSTRRLRRYTLGALALAAAGVAIAMGKEAVVSVVTHWYYLALVLFMLLVEWRCRDLAHGLQLPPRRGWVRIGLYMALLLLIMTSTAESTNFIYYQF